MKNIFKKNQVIITALAIMIAVAGYLNFTKDSADKGKDQVANSTNVNDDLALTDENDLYGDISDEDIADAGQQLNVSDDGSLVLNENADAETADGSVNKDDVAATDATGENAEVAGEDKVSSPGEAILASTTLDSSYFSTARLKREQVRSKNKELLWSIITSADVNEEDKKAALEDYTEIANISEKENAAEILLEAKGFDGVVVNIGEGTVDVIVNCESITDAQVAQIEDIVTRKTGADIKDIVITPVIAEE